MIAEGVAGCQYVFGYIHLGLLNPSDTGEMILTINIMDEVAKARLKLRG